MGDEFRIDPPGLLGIGRAIESSASGGTDAGTPSVIDAVAKVHEIAGRMLRSAGHDQYTGDFPEMVGQRLVDIDGAQTATAKGLLDIGTNVETVVIVSAAADDANAAVQRQIGGIIGQVEAAADV